MDEQPEKTYNLEEGSQSQQSTIKMKVDSPEESVSCNKEGNKTPNNPVAQGFHSTRPSFVSTGILGSSILASPRLGSNPFAAKPAATFGASPKLNRATSSSPSLPKPVFLRPSQLAVGNSESSQQTSCNTFPKAKSLGNPFARVLPGNENESKSGKLEEKSAETSTTSTEDIWSTRTVCSSNENKLELKESSPKNSGIASTSISSSSNFSPQKTSKSIMSPPKFVPLGTLSRSTEESLSSTGSISTSNVTSAPAATTSSTTARTVTGFVFGQNLHERVAASESVTSETNDGTSRSLEAAGSSKNMSSLCASATTNGTSEMLFTSVIKRDHSESNHNSSSSSCSNVESGEKPSKSLSEAAREYEEARAVKRKYEEVQVITGEEDEANVLQINCKLFAFDKAGGTWVERGRGTLRLNDKDSGPGGGVQSRVVIRTTGSLRVVLNTKIWAGMSVDRPSPKSVRLTAMDNSGQIKVFLVMSSPKETEQLHKSLEFRVHLAQRVSASQNQTQNETKSSDNDLASHSLPPEPCSKKRLSEDTSPTPDVTSI